MFFSCASFYIRFSFWPSVTHFRRSLRGSTALLGLLFSLNIQTSYSHLSLQPSIYTRSLQFVPASNQRVALGANTGPTKIITRRTSLCQCPTTIACPPFRELPLRLGPARHPSNQLKYQLQLYSTPCTLPMHRPNHIGLMRVLPW